MLSQELPYALSSFYEKSESSSIPFCDGPDSKSLSGSICFVNIPVKRNSLAPPNQAPTLPSRTTALLSKMVNKINSEFINGGSGVGGSSSSGDNNSTSVAATASGGAKLYYSGYTASEKSSFATASNNSVVSYVDYKRILLPLILAAIGGQSEDGSIVTDSSTLPLGNNNYGITNISHQQDDRVKHIQKMLNEIKEEQDKSRAQLLKTTAVLLPTDSQWYHLNQLRIHAGAPERSEEGIERLFR
jgi:hypothetical protein